VCGRLGSVRDDFVLLLGLTEVWVVTRRRRDFCEGAIFRRVGDWRYFRTIIRLFLGVFEAIGVKSKEIVFTGRAMDSGLSNFMGLVEVPMSWRKARGFEVVEEEG
jgi:hypothetical protein